MAAFSVLLCFSRARFLNRDRMAGEFVSSFRGAGHPLTLRLVALLFFGSFFLGLLLEQFPLDSSACEQDGTKIPR